MGDLRPLLARISLIFSASIKPRSKYTLTMVPFRGPYVSYFKKTPIMAFVFM